MKNTDLMIGDWIYLPEDPFKEYYYKVNNLNDSKPIIQGFFLSRFEPIPLTNEILEINGFNDDNELLGFYYAGDDRLRIDIVDIDNDVSITIKYVHELQHALRLCGYDNLADNFKIAIEK